MAKCEICEKGTVFGNNVSHSMVSTARMFKANVRRVKIVDKGTNRTAYVCTRCLRSNKVTRAV